MNRRRENDTIISSAEFYSEYHGHRVEHLQKLLPHLRQSQSATSNATTTETAASTPSGNIIWAAGDSSLDNKYWFGTKADAVGVYKDILRPRESICDVTYWLNYVAKERERQRQRLDENESAGNNTDTNKNVNIPFVAINTAVEATTLNERRFKLRDQDIFLRDNIAQDDILIVSIGGNDVALYPTPCTICSIGGLLCFPKSIIEHGTSCFTLPCNDYCCGCSTSLASCAGSCPPCMGYVRHLFGVRVQKYIEALTVKTRPRKILVCMIYYPDENVLSPSWAGGALQALGYNQNPEKLQAMIKIAFEQATSRITIDGSRVIPVPLYYPLDGTNSEDYVARVEPSAQGGRKMAEFLLDIIDNDDKGAGDGVSGVPYQSYQSPSPALISGRH